MLMAVAMAASPVLCPSKSLLSNQVEPTNCTSSTTLQMVCQQRDYCLERKTPVHHVSRRFLAVAAVSSIVAMGVFTQPEVAQAKRNKPPPPEEKKPVELEDKSLSKNELRVLANARRKEAMKATVEAAKARANSISSPE